jgi:O-antigen ligase
MATQVKLGDSGVVQSPLRNVILVLGLVLAWLILGGTPFLVILAVAGILIFGFKNPVLAMAIFFVTQFIFPSYMVSSISLRLLMLLILGAIILYTHIREGVQLGKYFRRLAIPLFILVGLCILSDAIYTDFNFVLKDFRNLFSGLLIALYIPAVIRNIKDLKLLCGVTFFVAIVTSIVALMQHYNIFGMAQSLYIPGRAQGISESELQLSYILGVTLLSVIGIMFLKAITTGRAKLILSGFLMLLALYFTYTRSALFALLFGFIGLLLFLKTRVKGEIILLIILVLTVFISVSGITDKFSFSARGETAQDASSIARKILWQAGIAIVKDYPILGIGGNRYIALSPQYISSVDPSLIQWEADRYWSYRTLGNDPVHNDFLNMWVSYGTIALIVFIWLIFVILNNFLSSFKLSRDKFLKSVSIGLAAGLISYIVNAFYHNLLSEFPMLWIIAGLSIATAKLADITNKKELVTNTNCDGK